MQALNQLNDSPGEAARDTDGGRDFQFTDDDFERLRELVSKHAGISLSSSKRQMVYSRLVRRLRALRMPGFREYCELLGSGHEEEMVQFINAITTNLTSFFREPHHFEHLRSEVLPALLHTRAANRRIRIWSAGCSTGEEPYSIAMTIAEGVPQLHQWDIKILATDLDTSVLARAEQGIYERSRVGEMDPARLKRWFLKGKGASSNLVRIRPEIHRLIHFRQLNLIQPWPLRGPFDAVFCRNVVIYFDKPTQRILFDRIADLTAADGHLYIGHSETLYRVCERYEPLGKTIYRRCA
jgi:chemotaxis protein methyltransferase CheR